MPEALEEYFQSSTVHAPLTLYACTSPFFHCLAIVSLQDIVQHTETFHGWLSDKASAISLYKMSETLKQHNIFIAIFATSQPFSSLSKVSYLFICVIPFIHQKCHTYSFDFLLLCKIPTCLSLCWILIQQLWNIDWHSFCIPEFKYADDLPVWPTVGARHQASSTPTWWCTSWLVTACWRASVSVARASPTAWSTPTSSTGEFPTWRYGLSWRFEHYSLFYSKGNPSKVPSKKNAFLEEECKSVSRLLNRFFCITGAWLLRKHTCSGLPFE